MTQVIDIYQVDAFAAETFKGNPAAVCPLEAWLPDATLQAIAAENNLAETAFIVPLEEGYDLRWFTPAVEVDLCGHATLGSAFVIATYLNPDQTEFRFQSRSGLLRVARDGDLYTLDFPSIALTPLEDAAVAEALGATPAALFSGMDFMAVFDREAEIRDLAPDMAKVAALETRGLIATAPGESCDFVSRFFAPQSGVAEDPVTGSAHCALTPYWSARLGKTRLTARQISPRGGDLLVEDRGERTLISGRVAPYLVGQIHV